MTRVDRIVLADGAWLHATVGGERTLQIWTFIGGMLTNVHAYPDGDGWQVIARWEWSASDEHAVAGGATSEADIRAALGRRGCTDLRARR